MQNVVDNKLYYLKQGCDGQSSVYLPTRSSHGTPSPTIHNFGPFLAITHVSEGDYPQRKRGGGGAQGGKQPKLNKFNTSLLPTSEAAINYTKVKNSSSMFQNAP
jgi:hypothetical protein